MNQILSFESVYGSLNYGLHRQDSDEDKMFFYIPRYEHLYLGKMATDDISDINTDRKHHDVRKIPQLFYKANVNFLEILYSRKVKRYDNLYEKLYAYREDIASMNISYLFDACMGMFRRNYKNFLRDTNPWGSGIHAKKVGKHAGSAYRILDFLQRYADFGFKDFQNAIFYNPENARDRKFYDLYMTMRDGTFHYDELDNLLKQKEKEVELLKPFYKEHKVKDEVNEYVISIVKHHVKEFLTNELSAKNE